MMIERQLAQDMNHYKLYDLQDLVDIGAVFIGMKVKCHTCGSNKWYSLAVASAAVSFCKS